MDPRAIISLVVLLIAQLVYWDTTRHKIGKNKEEKDGWLNMAAGAWAGLSCTTFLFLGPITCLLYLANRKKLIAKAIEHPVELSRAHRIYIHFLLVAIPVGLSYLLTPHY